MMTDQADDSGRMLRDGDLADPNRAFFDQPVGEWGVMHSPYAEAVSNAPDTASPAQYLAAFSGPAGERVLADLVRLFVDQPCFDPNLGEHAVNFGFTREGQAQVVRHIRGQMKRAMTEKETGNE